MTVRTQLTVAFFLLAVLPLTGIVLFSYGMSARAFRGAVENDARDLAGEIQAEIEAVRDRLAGRVEAVAALPLEVLLGGGPAAAHVYTDLMAVLGPDVELIDFFEFDPADPSRFGAEGSILIYPNETVAEAIVKLSRFEDAGLEGSAVTGEYLTGLVDQAIRRDPLPEDEQLAVRAREEQIVRLLGRQFASEVGEGRRRRGTLEASVLPTEILRRVLAEARRDEGDVAYAIDEAGGIYVENPADRERLAGLELGAGRGPELAPRGRALREWTIAEADDPQSGLTFGIARPIRDSLQAIEATAVRNFAAGLAMVIVAMVGILLLSGRMTRNLERLTKGAEVLASGDLRSRVRVRSKDEIGQLADTINRMAEQLSVKQQQLLDEERRRQEEQLQLRLLAAEHERKSRELEEAREFQLSLLPKQLPRYPWADVAVFMRTATEVGGDYYDFFPSGNGAVTAAIGDAAGHGARAGTMVTVVKGLFSVRAGGGELPEVLAEATRAVKRMDLERMNMAVSLARLEHHRLTIAAAGMPPALIYRHRESRIEEIALPGMPLGSLIEPTYRQWRGELHPGDTLLLMTDGFPELLDAAHEPFGYGRVAETFAAVDRQDPQEIVHSLAATAEAWTGGAPPQDDITFVVVRGKTA